MHSYWVYDNAQVFGKAVLILVLMEDALVPCGAKTIQSVVDGVS